LIGRFLKISSISSAAAGLSSPRRLNWLQTGIRSSGGQAHCAAGAKARRTALQGERDPGNPLEFPGGRILPSLSLSGRGEGETAVFFVIYPVPGGEKPMVTLEFLKDGMVVVKSTPDAGVADEVNALPLIGGAKLPAGDYVLRATVTQAGRRSQETTAVRVQQLFRVFRLRFDDAKPVVGKSVVRFGRADALQMARRAGLLTDRADFLLNRQVLWVVAGGANNSRVVERINRGCS
jgi:hypothetical protein